MHQNQAYKLDFPVSMKTHVVFAVEFLKPALRDPLPSQPQYSRPSPHIIKGQEEYEVEEILNSRHTTSAALEYMVCWANYSTPT
jgi:hypothetical protein